MAQKKAAKAPAKKTAAKKAVSKRVSAKKAPVKKAAAKKAATKTSAAKKVPARKAPAPAKTAKASAGRPGTAGKADGDAPVKAHIAAMKPGHREMAQKLDALIGETVPGVRRALKWSTPMYGVEGKGWFASIASFKNYMSLGFFAGTSLTPPPPYGESEQMRRINIHDESEYDEKLFRSWIKQASAIKGWGKVS